MKPRVVCKRCDTNFSRDFNLKIHLKTCNKKKVTKFKCPLWPDCEKVHKTNGLYSTKSNLRVHYKKHHQGSRLNFESVEKVKIDTNLAEESIDRDQRTQDDDEVTQIQGNRK